MSAAQLLTEALGHGIVPVAGLSAKKRQMHAAAKMAQLGPLAALTIVQSAAKSTLSIPPAKGIVKIAPRKRIAKRTGRRRKNGTRKIIIMSCGHRSREEVKKFA